MTTTVEFNRNNLYLGWGSRSEYPQKRCGVLRTSHCSSPLNISLSSLPTTSNSNSYESESTASHLNFTHKETRQLDDGNVQNWTSAIPPTPPDSPPPTSNLKSRGLVTSISSSLGLRNLLKVPTSNADHYFLTRQCSYIFYCLRIKANFNYPKLKNKELLKDDRVQEAIERVVTQELEETSLDVGADGKLYTTLISQHTRRTINILINMKAALSSSLIRLTGYVLFKVFSYLFMSVTVTEGQLQMIEMAAKRNVPLIFVPLHRSHVDYLFVTWVLFNREIPAPIVAAGDNLRIPVFGWLLRGLGGFFIKRKLESTRNRKDLVYRSLLQTYMCQALRSGYNLEFFIEGGRTRTGKPCLPKGGLLSVIIDAYLNGTLDDALIIPIAINYDKILDGNFIKEQLGQNKVPETFWRAVRAIVKVLSTSFGHSRIDFSQPFSLKEFFEASKKFLPKQTPSPINQDSLTPPSEQPDDDPKAHQRTLSTSTNNSFMNKVQNRSNGCLHLARSNSSLFGTEVNDEYREFVKSLASHIVYDAERCQAIMSTNAVSWLLSFQYREGTTLACLSDSLERLREDLQVRNRDVGFSGDSLSVTIHALIMLGSTLVHIEGDLKGDPTCIFVRPLTVLPNIIELNYYANALAPLYCIDAIVATSLVTLADCDLWSYKEISTDCLISNRKLTERSKRLCEILNFEFLFVPPCGNLMTQIYEAVHRLSLCGLLITENNEKGNTWRRCNYSLSTDEEDSDEATNNKDTYYVLSPTISNLEMIGTWTRTLSPLIDSYYSTISNLNSLINRTIPDKDFVHETQTFIGSMLEKGTLLYGESIAADPIRNALKLLEKENVLESYNEATLKLIYLKRNFESEEQLALLTKEMESYRV